MTETEAIQVVRSAISECLERSGRAIPDIKDGTKIIDGVAGFDSHCGLEATIDLEVRLGVKLSENVFIKEVNGEARARTLREVAVALVAMLRKAS